MPRPTHRLTDKNSLTNSLADRQTDRRKRTDERRPRAPIVTCDLAWRRTRRWQPPPVNGFEKVTTCASKDAKTRSMTEM